MNVVSSILRELNEERNITYKEFKIFQTREEAETFVKDKKNKVGMYNISLHTNSSGQNDYILRYDVLSNSNDPFLEFSHIWGKSESHNQPFIDKHRKELKGMVVYYISFEDKDEPYQQDYNKKIYYRREAYAEYIKSKCKDPSILCVKHTTL